MHMGSALDVRSRVLACTWAGACAECAPCCGGICPTATARVCVCVCSATGRAEAVCLWCAEAQPRLCKDYSGCEVRSALVRTPKFGKPAAAVCLGRAGAHPRVWEACGGCVPWACLSTPPISWIEACGGCVPHTGAEAHHQVPGRPSRRRAGCGRAVRDGAVTERQDVEVGLCAAALEPC